MFKSVRPRVQILWFGISVPLVYIGSYLAFKKPAIDAPVTINNIPRMVPDQVWYMQPQFSVLVGGVLPFGAVFIEIFFIMSSVRRARRVLAR